MGFFGSRISNLRTLGVCNDLKDHKSCYYRHYAHGYQGN